MVTVTEAVLTRRSTRAFLPVPIAGGLIEEILALAARAPSGGNLQPWRVDAVAGEALDEIRRLARESLATDPKGEPMELTIYPSPLPEPWRSRRFSSGEALYATLGIPREDKAARLAQFSRNFDFFGAPAALFFSIPRLFDRPQWAHLGMFMQNVMLLAEERGLATCPQEAWAAVSGSVSALLELPEDHLLYCGMAIGRPDPAHPANALRTEREPVTNFARFRGF
ncbi:MAG TPA: nitroreductase [Allosphingosinicella sp.]